MFRRPWLAALLAPILLLAYGGGLGRGFVSEDFLILRRLGSGPFLERAAESFLGPWLGASFVPFYRPFSSLLLQVELLAFGTHPLPYLLAHLAVHAGCALLLGAWLGRLLPAAAPHEIFLATLVFALYPLHPGSVLFVASFATLFATLFLLAALWLEAADRRGLALAVAPLALFSYEQAVALPFLALLFDLAAKPGDGFRRRLRLWPYFAMTGAYLLLRSAVLGQLGGYDGFRARLADPAALLTALAEVLSRLFVPVFAIPASAALTLSVTAALALLAAVAVVRRQEPGARVLLAALAAIPVVQAPFFFTGVVPGNGRYFYLASCLAAIVLWQGLRLLPHRAVAAVAPVLLVLALGSAWGLRQVATVYGEAARRCDAIRTSLEAAPPGRIFVAGHPAFLNRWGVPVAQVFHWGLADALEPPFTERGDLEVYPLPGLSDADLAPLLFRPELGRVFRLGEADRLQPLVAAAAPAAIEARRDGLAPRLLVRAPPGATLRLVVLAQGGPSLLPLPPGEGEIAAEVPQATFTSMKLLYGTPIFVWVEVRGAGGELAGTSAVFEM